MPTSAGEVEVKLTLDAAQLKAGLADSQQSLNNFNGVLEKVGTALVAAFSLAKIAGFFKDSLDAYATNELAVTRLVAALNNQGTASQKAVDDLTGMAHALQELTGTSKNEIIASETLLTTFGVTVDMMPKVIQTILDLAAATGIDLQRATLLVGKAFEGNTSMLSRYGIIISKHIETSNRFAVVMDAVNQRFGGAAQAQADTYTGRLNIMEQRFNDLKEAIGKLLEGPAGGLVKWLSDAIQSFTGFIGEVSNTKSFLDGLALVIGNIVITAFENLAKIFVAFNTVLLQVLSTLPLIGSKFQGLIASSQSMNTTITQQAGLWRDLLAVQLTSEQKKQDAVLQTKSIVIQSQDLQSKAVADAIAEETKLRSKAAADDKAAYMDFGKSFITTTADMWKFATTASNTFFQGLGDAWAKQVIEGKNFSEAMKTLFRDMVEQIISYLVQLIAKQLELLALETATGTTPGGSGAGIGSFFTGAFASGGVISEPSIILGLKSGSRTLAGESGPEMVSPMNGGNAGDSGGGGGGQGGNITINISGQFVEGDAASWRAMVNQQIIPAIRRYSMSNPTGPFNRTRGVV